MKKLLLAGVLLVIGLVWLANSPYRLCESEGWSMYDKLPPWNMNLVNTAPLSLDVGDTVLAYSPISGRLITHDIVAVNGDTYQLQGYNGHTNPYPDGWVERSSIIGEVVTVLGIPLFVNLSLLFMAVCVSFVPAFFASALHDRYEDQVSSKTARKFEDFFIMLGVVYTLLLILWMTLFTWGWI